MNSINGNLNLTTESYRLLLVGAAPERCQEISDMIGAYNLSVQLYGDNYEGNKFLFDAGAYRYIRFNHRSVRTFWVGGFVAWEAYLASSGASDDDNSKLKELISLLQDILQAKDPEEVVLPSWMPTPGDMSSTDPHIKAAVDLSIIALAWAFIHEYRHIKHQQEGTSAPNDCDPNLAHDEELSCDRYATDFIVEKIDDFADDNNKDSDSVRKKRALGIYVALFVMTLITRDNWGETKKHPSLKVRIDETSKIIGVSFNPCAHSIAVDMFSALNKIWSSSPTL